MEKLTALLSPMPGSLATGGEGAKSPEALWREQERGMTTGLCGELDHGARPWEADVMYLCAKGCIRRGYKPKEAIAEVLRFMAQFGYAGPVNAVTLVTLRAYAHEGE